MENPQDIAAMQIYHLHPLQGKRERAYALDIARRKSGYLLVIKDFLLQCRTGISEVTDINIMNANAWLQTAINLGAQEEVETFDKKRLIEIIPEIRNMTIQKPSVFYPRLKI